MIWTLIRGAAIVMFLRGAKRAAVASIGTMTSVSVGAAALWLVPGASMSWVLPPVTSAASLFILGAFPDVVKAIHRQGTTLDDIEAKLIQDPDPKTIRTRRTLYNAFTGALVLTTAISVGLIVDYSMFYNEGVSNLTSLESIGVIGGMLSLAKRAQRKIGSGLIMLHSFSERLTRITRIAGNNDDTKKDVEDGVEIVRDATKDAEDLADEVMDAVMDIV